MTGTCGRVTWRVIATVVHDTLRKMSGSSAARARNGSSATPAQDRATTERQARLLDFLADPPPEILAAADAVGRAREQYGEDTDRELADIEAGRHPLQRRAAKTRAR